MIYVEGEDDEHIEPHLVFQMYCEFGECVRGKEGGGSNSERCDTEGAL